MTPRIFILLILNQALAWRHPPALFIDEFANVHKLNMIVTYISDNSASDWMEWHSNHQKIQKNSRIKQMSYKSQKEIFAIAETLQGTVDLVMMIMKSRDSLD